MLAIVLMAKSVGFANNHLGHWAESEMLRFNRYGIVQGDEKGNLNPNKTMTRAEVFTMLAKMYGEDIEVEKGRPYYFKAVERLGEYGLIEKAQMNPLYLTQPMPRGEVVMLFSKAFYLTPDLKNIEEVAKQFSLEKYIVGNEKGDLILNKTISRAEVVKILGNIFPHVLLKGQVVEYETYTGNVWLLGDEVSLVNTEITGKLILSPKNSVSKKITVDHSMIGNLVIPPFYKGELELRANESKVSKVTGKSTIKLNGKKVPSMDLAKLLEVVEGVNNTETNPNGAGIVALTSPPLIEPLPLPLPQPNPEPRPLPVDAWVNQDSLKWVQIEGSAYLIFELKKGKLLDYTLFSGEQPIHMSPINHEGTLVKALLKSNEAPLSLKNSKGEVQKLLKQVDKLQSLSKEEIALVPMGQKVSFGLPKGHVELDTVTGATPKGSTAIYHIGNMPLGVKAQVVPHSNGFGVEFIDERPEKSKIEFTAVFKWLTHSIKGVTPTANQFDFEFKVQLGQDLGKPEVNQIVKRVSIEGVPYLIIDLNKEEKILWVQIDGTKVHFTPINHWGSMVKIALTKDKYQNIQIQTETSQYDIK